MAAVSVVLCDTGDAKSVRKKEKLYSALINKRVKTYRNYKPPRGQITRVSYDARAPVYASMYSYRNNYHSLLWGISVGQEFLEELTYYLIVKKMSVLFHVYAWSIWTNQYVRVFNRPSRQIVLDTPVRVGCRRPCSTPVTRRINILILKRIETRTFFTIVRTIFGVICTDARCRRTRSKRLLVRAYRRLDYTIRIRMYVPITRKS